MRSCVAGTKLTREPAGVAYVDWLDRTHLQQKSDSLPDAADLVIGLGGGRALDASKFVAIDKQLPLILVPTVLSTGAIIHGHFSHYEGRTRQIGHSPWRNCEYVLVDFGVVLASPLHLTTAGLGDILCNYGGVAEWRRNAARGVGPRVDEEAIDRSLQGAAQTLGAGDQRIRAGVRVRGDPRLFNEGGPRAVRTLCPHARTGEWRTLPGAVALPGEFLKKSSPFPQSIKLT